MRETNLFQFQQFLIFGPTHSPVKTALIPVWSEIIQSLVAQNVAKPLISLILLDSVDK